MNYIIITTIIDWISLKFEMGSHFHFIFPRNPPGDRKQGCTHPRIIKKFLLFQFSLSKYQNFRADRPLSIDFYKYRFKYRFMSNLKFIISNMKFTISPMKVIISNMKLIQFYWDFNIILIYL